MSRWVRDLNPEQKRAVLSTDGPLLVLAGAGSGKTRVITHRIAHLMDLGVAAENIVAVTFTNKAAEEMRARLARMVGKGTANRLTLSTFHSLGLQMLKDEARRLSRPRRFTIFDTGDQLGVLRELLGRLNMGRAFDLGSLLARISAYKNAFVDPTAVKVASDDPYEEAAAQLYPLYQEQLGAYAAFDFDDLVCEPARLLTTDEGCRAHWRAHYRYVLVDEYQDTNGAQLRLLKGLVDEPNRNICVVGDDDQSIYGWRGAEVRNILQFERDFPGGERVYLMRNYRSVGAVLAVANAAIAPNSERHPKQLLPTREPGETVRLVVTPDGDAEVGYVAREIKKALTRGRAADEIAVLYRSNLLGRSLEGELREHGIVYRVLGGTAFYERKEVKDVIAYLRLVSNSADELSLRRAINTPTRGIGPRTVAKLAAWAEEHRMSFFRAIEAAPSVLSDDPRAARAVQGFGELIGELHTLASRGRGERLVGLAQRVVDAAGFRGELERNSPSAKAFDRRWGNIEAFCNGFDGYFRRRPEASFGDFLARIALTSADDDPQQQPGVVTLSTLHGAKGLEYGMVFLIGVEEGFLPHNRTMNPQENDIEGGDIAEERRLFYVGITRAKDQLVLTRASHRLLRGKPQARTASRFLEPIPDALFAHDDLSSPPAPEDVQVMMANLRRMLGGAEGAA